MKDRMWCEYCPLEELRRVIREKYFIKIFEKEPSDEMLEENHLENMDLNLWRQFTSQNFWYLLSFGWITLI